MLDAAWQSNVVPVPRYSVFTLINLYAMIVLGGIGSLPGAVIGAFIFTLLPEILRSVALSVIFYGLSLWGLYIFSGSWRRFGRLLAFGILFGFVLKGLLLLLNVARPI
ncbi:MAG: hypothetical protein R2865_16635 [Deinococcales bacterium]